MSAALPRAAVVVPVFNGAATLPDCLASLRALDYPAERLELIVVDNASTDATPRLLAAAGPPFRVLHEARRGPSAARNRGMAACTAEVIALTDADCTVDPAWLRHLVAALADPAVGLAGGRILSRRPCNPIEAFGERIHDHARAIHEFAPPYVITMNWAARRAVVEALGGFDESLRRGEDVDYGYRAFAAGHGLAYVPEAVIYHRNERTPWGLAHEGYTHALHADRVHAKHAALLARLASAPARRPETPVVAAAPPHWSDPLWWRVFRFGKRLGRAHAAWRRDRASRA